MNKRNRRELPVFLIGGSADGQIASVPVNRACYRIVTPVESEPVALLFADETPPNPQATFEQREEVYMISRVCGHLDCWRIGWPVAWGGRGIDKALSMLFGKYVQQEEAKGCSTVEVGE